MLMVSGQTKSVAAQRSRSDHWAEHFDRIGLHGGDVEIAGRIELDAPGRFGDRDGFDSVPEFFGGSDSSSRALTEIR